LVFRASDLIRGCTNAAKRSVVNEFGLSQRGCRNRHFFDNGTDNVRDVRKRSTIDGVNIGRFARKNATNLPNDTIDIFGGEILDRRQRNTVISHSFRILLGFKVFAPNPVPKLFGATLEAVKFPRVQENAFSSRTRHVGALFSACLAALMTAAGRCYNGSSIPICRHK
jgi:hypothetical protein